MRFICIVLVLLSLNSCDSKVRTTMDFANNEVIAHRGAWKAKGLPENSIASLKHAIELNCAGSEFDVRMTSDGVLVVNHDPTYHDLNIEETTFADLSKFKLSNGELFPKLKDMLLAGMKDNDSTGLVCEIKPSKIEGRSIEITDKTLDLIKALNADAYVTYYISFSYEIIKHIKKRRPNAKVLYLEGSKSPEVLQKDSIDGLDYSLGKIKRNPQWIKEAKDIQMVLNAWTVNKIDDIDWLLDSGFDYITTNEPELVFKRIKERSKKEQWKLVWKDEFDYSGVPDSSKWAHEIGFKRNQEKQYYTDSLKNVRVEDGHLILKAYKEDIKNAAFESESAKNWRKNQQEANYTSASLTTKNLAEWKYGRVDIKAKLPKGVGLWPAFWMLGENYKDVGWPECGEIDIMEHVGFNADSIFGTVHTKAYNHTIGTQRGRTTFVDQPYDEFHDYSIVWTPEYIDFLLDGKVYNHFQNDHKTTAEWPFDQNFHLKINIAIGGMLGGKKGIDDAIFPQQMIIDYVRVYQKEE